MTGSMCRWILAINGANGIMRAGLAGIWPMPSALASYKIASVAVMNTMAPSNEAGPLAASNRKSASTPEE